MRCTQFRNYDASPSTLWSIREVLKVKRNLLELEVISKTKPYMRSLKHHGHIICVSQVKGLDPADCKSSLNLFCSVSGEHNNNDLTKIHEI